MAALITLCNQALNLVAAGTIAALDESSPEASRCKTFAQPLLNEMVEWSDDFGFGRKRVVLAALANDRPAEWLYAYAAPSDMATPIAIRSVEDAAFDLPIGGPYTLPLQDIVPLAFVAEEGRIYTNVETATLIYTASTVEAATLSSLGQWAFVTELASRISLPLKKDAKLADAMSRKAEVARARWVADEENKNPRRATRYTSEAEYARAGYEG
jgi:hypothetical protein